MAKGKNGKFFKKSAPKKSADKLPKNMPPNKGGRQPDGTKYHDVNDDTGLEK